MAKKLERLRALEQAEVEYERDVSRGRIYFEHGSYEGELKDGLPHGEGTLVFGSQNFHWGSTLGADHAYPAKEYAGQWRYGKMHGNGKITFKHGGFYEGDWADNMMTGRGKRLYTRDDDEADLEFGIKFCRKNGLLYIGEMVDGYRHGRGRQYDEPENMRQKVYAEWKKDKPGKRY